MFAECQTQTFCFDEWLVLSFCVTCAFVCGNPLLPLEGFDCNFAFCTSGFGRESGEELRCFNTFWLNGADMFLCSCRWEATLGKCFRNCMRSLQSESSLGIEHGWHPLSFIVADS